MQRNIQKKISQTFAKLNIEIFNNENKNSNSNNKNYNFLNVVKTSNWIMWQNKIVFKIETKKYDASFELKIFESITLIIAILNNAQNKKIQHY